MPILRTKLRTTQTENAGEVPLTISGLVPHDRSLKLTTIAIPVLLHSAAEAGVYSPMINPA